MGGCWLNLKVAGCIISRDLLSRALKLLFQNFKTGCKNIKTREKIDEKLLKNYEKKIWFNLWKKFKNFVLLDFFSINYQLFTQILYKFLRDTGWEKSFHAERIAALISVRNSMYDQTKIFSDYCESSNYNNNLPCFFCLIVQEFEDRNNRCGFSWS